MKLFVEPEDIYLHVLPVDFRKSINGLLVIVESELELNAFTGALFLFSNKKRNKLKVLHWDKTGFGLTLDGQLSIDNNRAERAIKPFVIGRSVVVQSNSQRCQSERYNLFHHRNSQSQRPFDCIMHLLQQLSQPEPDTEHLLPWNVRFYARW